MMPAEASAKATAARPGAAPARGRSAVLGVRRLGWRQPNFVMLAAQPAIERDWGAERQASRT